MTRGKCGRALEGIYSNVRVGETQILLLYLSITTQEPSAHRGLLLFGGNNQDVPETLDCFDQSSQSRRVNAVIIGYEYEGILWFWQGCSSLGVESLTPVLLSLCDWS